MIRQKNKAESVNFTADSCSPLGGKHLSRPYRAIVFSLSRSREVVEGWTPLFVLSATHQLWNAIATVSAVSLLLLMTGCYSTVAREYSVSEVVKNGRLAYAEVNDVKSLKQWNSDAIPVTVSSETTTNMTGMTCFHPLVWLCTLGIAPWNRTETTHSVSVQTPLGTRRGTCVETRRDFVGWIPCLFLFSPEKEKEDCEKELTVRLVAQFSSRWNAAVERAKKRNAEAARQAVEKDVRKGRGETEKIVQKMREEEIRETRARHEKERIQKQKTDADESNRAVESRQWNERQIAILRTFALQQSPKLWETVQVLQSDQKVHKEKLEQLCEELKLFGRDPDTDADCLALRRANDDIGKSIQVVYGKIEEAYLAFKKFEATPGRKEYSETMRRALEDGIKEAEATEHRYKEMTRQK
ncbi:MAG: hypothetical protein IKR48_10180 [Kiritimatiellae bacterium]|nr:hypothetical protein [Kiritimatiellia bacterium]